MRTVPWSAPLAYGTGHRTGLLDRCRAPTTISGVQDHPEDSERSDEEGNGENLPTGPESADGDAELPFPGAAGIDPEQPDPGCEHDWRNLHFLEDDEGLACLRCARAWAVDDGDSRDAVLTLWNSTRRAVEDLTLQQERLTRIVEEITGSVRCHWCHRWSDEHDEFVNVRSRRSCPEHLGQLLGEVVPADDDEIVAVRSWLCGVLETRPGDVYTAWLAEKAAVECPELVDDADATDLTIAGIGSRGLELPETWSLALKLPEHATVDNASTSVARLLDLPRPLSRPGRSLLLGALARAVRAWELGAPMDAEALTAVLLEAAPSGNRDRATVVLDLYREEMQVDGTVTGEMADDLVEALIGRAASEFSGLVPAAAPRPEDGESGLDPR